MEAYLSGSKLIPKDEWQLFIDGLKASVPESLNYEELLEKLETSLEDAILKRARECAGKIGLFFSGGVDSTFIAYVLKKNNISFTAVTVGFHTQDTKEPEDLVESRKVAQVLNLDHKEVILNLDEVEELFENTKHVLGSVSDPISLGVGSVVVAAARSENIKHWFGGLGSEEIFAGYQRHDEAQDVQEECWAGLVGMYERDLIRDCKIGAALNIKVHTPFLDDTVISYAMAIPGDHKIKEHEGIMQKKYCLRELAENMGLAKEFAWRPKRAAQYGSRTDSAMDKIARKKGMTKKVYACLT